MSEPTKRPTVASLTEANTALREEARISYANFEERIAELELEREDVGWLSLSGASEKEFTRQGLRKVCLDSFLFYLKNPLVKRAVDTQSAYVFGQGITIKAEHPLCDEVIQEFMDDSKNRKELTTLPMMVKAEGDLRIDANLFFCFFKNDIGQVRITLIPFDEIWDTYTNPENCKEVWYYLRQFRGADGKIERQWYPDWEYRPEDREPFHKGKEVMWDSPVHHLKVNVVLNQKFGVSEIYAAQDWARAYNRNLSDWATVVRSYAMFAWDIVKKSGKSGLLAAKSRLDSKISEGGYQPAKAPGSALIHDKDTEAKPFKTAGATTSPESGRRLLLMVCAAFGLPETFFGDVSVGTLATAKSLDRPTELNFSLRQNLWEILWEEISAYVIRVAAEFGYESKNPDIHGKLTGHWEKIEGGWEEEVFVYGDDTGNEDLALKTKPIDTTVTVTFPKLLEDDMQAVVTAIVSAATLDGKADAGVFTPEYVTEKLMRAIGETSIEEALKKRYPNDEEGQAEQKMAGAIQDLSQAIETLSEVREMDREEIIKVLANTFIEAIQKEKLGASKEV